MRSSVGERAEPDDLVGTKFFRHSAGIPTDHPHRDIRSAVQSCQRKWKLASRRLGHSLILSSPGASPHWKLVLSLYERDLGAAVEQVRKGYGTRRVEFKELSNLTFAVLETLKDLQPPAKKFVVSAQVAKVPFVATTRSWAIVELLPLTEAALHLELREILTIKQRVLILIASLTHSA